MRVARIQIEEFAAPLLALVVDGAYYDVAKLEERWGIAGMFGSVDFQQRVVGAACAGLETLEARLTAGDRPTEARLMPGEFLPLPPCDADRAAYFQLGPYDLATAEPVFQQRDSRSLMGDGQPVSFPAGATAAAFEAGVAVVVGDDLHRAGAREAERCIAGVTLVLDWTTRLDRWERGGGPDVASQLGSLLLVGPLARHALRGEAWLEIAGARRPAGRVSAWRFAPAESIAFLSHHVRLRAGDVIGLGCLPAGRVEQHAFNAPVSLGIDRLLSLSGSAARGAPLPEWRLPSKGADDAQARVGG